MIKKTEKEIYFETEDLEHLNERRLTIGLEFVIID
jgi:hypothetical protein